MDILFFSINIIGCLAYFLFSYKSHQSKPEINIVSNDINKASTDEKIQEINSKLSEIQKQLQTK